MRALRIGVITAIVSVGLLFAAYPWPVTYRNSHHGAIILLLSYLLVALLVGLVVAASVGLTSLEWKVSASSRGALTGMISLPALFFFSILMGPFGLSIPGTAVRVSFLNGSL